jgi:hypothetical protein
MKLMATANYLALGDSISIDDCIGVDGGGAASQLARQLDLDLVDLTRDGNITDGVLADLASAPVDHHRRGASRIRFSIAKLSSTPCLTPRRASCGRRAAGPLKSISALSWTTVSLFSDENP